MKEVEIIKIFGDPYPFMGTDGHVVNSWQALMMDYVHFPEPVPYCANPSLMITRFLCHKKLASKFLAIFSGLHAAGHWGLIEDFGGCYNFRRITAGKGLSLHSWGIAMDLNVGKNPRGSASRMPPEIVTAFTEQGFLHGDVFKGRARDPMHFEWAGGEP